MNRPLKIYVASSWRNKHQPNVVVSLRADGHDVYDFRNPEPGDNGFRWSAIDPAWEEWTTEKYAAALNHRVARRGFALDLGAVLAADLCVLVLPSGRSASWEYGYHAGMTGRPGIVYMPEKCEPELMYSGSIFTDSLPQLSDVVRSYAQRLVAADEHAEANPSWVARRLAEHVRFTTVGDEVKTPVLDRGDEGR